MREMWFTFENQKSLTGEENYTCYIKQLCSPCNWENITYNFYFHKSGFKDADVKSVIIEGESCNKIPEKLIEFFPNMESLEIKKTSMKSFEKENMIKFKKLKRFSSIENKISILYANMFDEFENLECIQFDSNSLLLIDVMSIRSNFMAQLLQEQPTVREITFDDIHPEIFDEIIKYIYNYELPDVTDFIHLFCAASKLQLQGLMDHTEACIIDNIDDDNAIEFFVLGHNYDRNEIKTKAYMEIKKKYRMFGFKDDWLADTDGLVEILEGFKE